jgi:hypothetical protein
MTIKSWTSNGGVWSGSAEFLKSTGLTRKTGEYFQCPVYFGISLVKRTSKIYGQIRTSKYFKVIVGNSA